MASTNSPAPPHRLAVIGLISGGKDSIFSLLHCIDRGHKIVALANLHPADRDELDSYMYQTVGHNLVNLYSKALELPVYRQEIRGAVVDYSKDYGSQGLDMSSDETEALVPLLRRVKEHHPDANALSSGAILSTYQRTRVESVCARLALTPLAYLWQYPHLPPLYSQTSLLKSMFSSGLDARIIKVASGAFDESFLWQSVAAPNTTSRMLRALAKFGDLEGGSVLGEGGEFETLVIDGPEVLFKKRLDVPHDTQSVIRGEGGTWSLKIDKAELLDKPTSDTSDVDVARHREQYPLVLDSPHLLDKESQRILNEASLAYFTTLWRRKLQVQPSISSLNQCATSLGSHKPPKQNLGDFFVLFPNIASDRNENHADSKTKARQEMRAIVQRFKQSLSQRQIGPENLAFTMIILRNMSDFAAVNEEYQKIFRLPNPPARATVACGDLLPPDTNISVSFTACRADYATERKGLHVQSWSYWAPANIGPYSQAVSIPTRPALSREEDDERMVSRRLVYLSGQIPLVPATMQPLVEASFAKQAVLSLQHLWRVARAVDVSWWLCGVAFITADSTVTALRRAHTALNVWHEAASCKEDEKVDEGSDPDLDLARDAEERRLYGNAAFQRTDVSDSTFIAQLPDYSSSPEVFTNNVCVVAEVAELPREALIEWAGLGLAGRGCSVKHMTWRTADGTAYNCTHWGEANLYYICARSDNHGIPGRALLSRIASDGWSLFNAEILQCGQMDIRSNDGEQVSIIPCRTLWDWNGELVSSIVRGFGQRT